MLDSEKLWIADTGAMSQVTKYVNGGKNRHDLAIKLRDCMNDSMTGNFEIDIPLTCRNKEENEIRSAKLKDVQMNDRFNFNHIKRRQTIHHNFEGRADFCF